jgi:putative oxidoreductase
MGLLVLKRFHPFGPLRKSFVLLVVRILVGVVLLIKGILFLSNSEQLEQLILSSRFAAGVVFLTAYITFAHLFGGVFIILGLLTRIAALLQIPILLGAVFLVLPWQVHITGVDELILSIVVLGLLLFILWKGSGEFSMGQYLKRHLL